MSASATLPPAPMTADQFLAWTVEQPDDERYELVDGRVQAMAPALIGHARAIKRIAVALDAAIAAAGLPCETFLDGPGVRVGASSLFVADVVVQCGERADDDSREIADPLVVIEVVSPSTRLSDAVRKLIGYFEIASVRHYLVVDPGVRQTIHYARDTGGVITTRIFADEPIRLDPPGMVLAGIFPGPA